MAPNAHVPPPETPTSQEPYHLDEAEGDMAKAQALYYEKAVDTS